MVNKLIVLFIISISSAIYANEPVNIKTLEDMSARSTPVYIPMIRLKDFHNLPKNTVYSQILSYSMDKPFGDHHGRITNVHETVHGINNYLNNSFRKEKVRGFYASNGRAILLQQPTSIKLADIIPYIPDILKEYRYKTYFVESLKPWNDVPFYAIDEWSAYIAGAECALDDYKNKVPAKERLDSVSGALEFSIYCVALSMCIKQQDPNYWHTYPEFKNSIHYYLVKSEKLFFEGKDIFPFARQNTLLINLQNHTDAMYIRNFLITEFEGIFIR